MNPRTHDALGNPILNPFLHDVCPECGQCLKGHGQPNPPRHRPDCSRRPCDVCKGFREITDGLARIPDSDAYGEYGLIQAHRQTIEDAIESLNRAWLHHEKHSPTHR